MSTNLTVDITKINIVAASKGVDTFVVRALAGLSEPIRSNLRKLLVTIKIQLQGKITAAGFKNKILKRKQLDVISNAQGQAQAELSKIKRMLGNLNIGPDFTDNAGLQTIINLLLSNVKIKGLSIGGYHDADNILNSINFQINQLEKAANLTEITSRAMNKKIDEVNKFIEVIDALDTIASAS